MNILYIALGGFLGSILRFYISIKMEKRLIATWIANITGSMALAFLWYYYSINSLSHLLWLFLGVGFCGSYTTFSTFGNETLQLVFDKKYKLAIIYIASSIFVAFVVVFVVLSTLGYKF